MYTNQMRSDRIALKEMSHIASTTDIWTSVATQEYITCHGTFCYIAMGIVLQTYVFSRKSYSQQHWRQVKKFLSILKWILKIIAIVHDLGSNMQACF